MRSKGILLAVFFGLLAFVCGAQAPGCPNIISGPDLNLPCSTPCTTLTTTPFHVGATTTYTVSSIPHTPPYPYNGAGTAVGAGTDDVWSPTIGLPFNFCYYGTNYTTVKVGSNGAIMFGPAVSGGFQPWSFTANCPSPALVTSGHVFGVFHDINPAVPGSGTVRWALIGTAPCRMFVVTYDHIRHFSCSANSSTHEMVLYETTNVIEVYIAEKFTCAGWNGGRAICGIQDNAGTAGLAAPGRNTAPTWTVAAANPEAWRFTPNGAPTYNVQWYQNTVAAPNLIGTGNTVSVCPTGNTTYIPVVTYTKCDGTTITDQDPIVVNFTTLPAPTVNVVNETCNGYNNGSVVINNPVGAGPYTVTITGPANPAPVVEPNTAAGVATFNNLPDGTYNYTVVGNNGCTYTGTFTINPGPTCCTVNAVNTNVSCNGGNNGTATAVPTGLAGFTYSWAPTGQTSQTATGLPAGAYTVTMTDASGCVATANVNITQPTAINASTIITNITCNGLCNGTIMVNATGGTGALQYSINGGAFQASNIFTGQCAGNKTIIVRDANNCTVTLNVVVTQPAPLAVSTVTITGAICGSSNGGVTVAGSGGTAPYQFSINGGATFQASPIFTGLAPGNYTVIIRDANNCTSTVNLTITSSPAPVLSVQTQTNLSCFGGSNGSVLLGITGGSAPIMYSIAGPVNAGPQASNSFTGLLAGNYTALSTDANGCTANTSFTITAPTQLTYTSIPTAALCNGQCSGQILINASGGTPPYQYSSNNGLTFFPANPMTGLCAGNINVVVRDANGCLANSVVAITQPTAVGGAFFNTNPICFGSCNGQIVVNANGGTSPYQYSITGVPGLQAGNSFNGLCAGTQNVLIQDSQGCQFTSPQTLVNPPQIVINTVSTTPSNCGFNDGGFEVSATGPNAIVSYAANGGAPQASGIFPSLVGGAYTVVVTDAIGCTNSTFVGVNDIQMSAIQTCLTDATCNGVCDGTFCCQNVGGGLPISYELDNTSITQPIGNYIGLCAGPHIVTVYDAGLCVATLTFSINEPTPITFNTTVTDVACNGGATGGITFTGTAGGTGAYQFSTDGGITYQASPVFTGLASGTYNLVVMDANNCTSAGTATINQATPITYVLNTSDAECAGSSTGFLQIVASGGTPPYQHQLTAPSPVTTALGPNFTYPNIPAGPYTFIIQDNAGCQINNSVVINEPAPLAATYVITAASCNGVCDGTIQVNATGGTTPYQYSSDNGVTYFISSLLSPLCAGTYNVAVKDDNGCTITSAQTVTEPAMLTITATSTAATCGNSNGTITITGGGGVPPYTFSNDNGTSFVAGNVFNALADGLYDIAVEDDNGCQVFDTITVQDEASPIITALFTTDVNCNAACDGAINVTASGGTGALSYDVGGAGQPTGVFNSLCANAYVVTVTDVNGCTATQNTTITEPAALTFTTVLADLLCNADNSGEITINAVGGVTPYLYSFDNGTSVTTIATQTGLAAGTYNLITEDANGCQTPATVVLNEPTPMVITAQNTTNASCHSICDGQATITLTGGTVAALYTYNWSGGVAGTNQNTAINLCAGTYVLDILDDNGCALNTTFNVTEPPAVVITSYTSTDVLCNGDCNGTITVFSPNAVNYSSDNGNTFQPGNVLTGLCPNTYQVVVEDANGCPTGVTAVIGEPSQLVLDPVLDITICYDGYGVLAASANGGTQPYYFIWNTGDTVQYLGVHLTAPTSFTCQVADANGCLSNTQSANVNILPAFIPSVANSVDSICPGAQANFSASGAAGIPGYSFMWITTSPADTITSPTLTFTPTAPQQVMLVAADQCPTQDTLYVDVVWHTLPTPMASASPGQGCAPLNVLFTNTTPPNMVGGNCQWTFSNGDSGTSCDTISTTFLSPGSYDAVLTITSPQGCVNSTTFSSIVTVHPDPVAFFSWNPAQPTILNGNVTFQDLSIDAVGWNWDIAGLATSTAQNPSYDFTQLDTGQYLVCQSVVSQYGCVDTLCQYVTIYDELLVYVPNAFTPDGDGINDIFLPVVRGMNPEDYELLIFNRWGQMVFQSTAYDKGWDGLFKNLPVKSDVYVWKLKVKNKLNEEKREYFGHVNLLK